MLFARTSLACALLLVAAIAHAEPDEAVLGKDRGYPVGAAGNWYVNPYRVGSWSAMDRVRGLPVRTVSRGDVVTPLPVAAGPPAIRYRFRNTLYTLDGSSS